VSKNRGTPSKRLSYFFKASLHDLLEISDSELQNLEDFFSTDYTGL
jgi:hypothetical protein